MCLYSQWQGNKNCARLLFMIWHGLVYIYILHSWIKKYYVFDFRKRTNFLTLNKFNYGKN